VQNKEKCDIIADIGKTPQCKIH